MKPAAPIGLQIIRDLCKPAWLIQPEQDLRFFKEHPCPDAFWSTAKPLWKYDKHSAYLACASSVKLGVGRYYHTFDLMEPVYTGLYRVHTSSVAPRAKQLLPIGESWQWNNVLRMASRLGANYIVKETYFWEETHAVLEPFYRALRQLRCEDEKACKWLYRRTFGMLAHWPKEADGVTDRQTLWEGCLFRPDWWNLLRAELKQRMYYHALQVQENEGLWPCWMHVDELGYLERVTSLRMDEGIGAFREKEVPT